MKLCVFQGTFNPVHNAHLKMAEFVINNFDIDKIIFIPAFKPPHKDYNKSLTPHRYEMVKLAISNNPHFELSDIEYKSDRTSYTYLTILELYKQFNFDDKIYFIIGTDAFKNIESWYETEELKKLVKFIVFTREENPQDEIFENLNKKGYNFEFAKMDFCDISSTDIRNKIKNNENITDLIPQQVKEYIEKNELYKC